MSASDGNQDTVVYLEDVEVKKVTHDMANTTGSANRSSGGATASPSSSQTSARSVAVVGTKRQATLMDMFGQPAKTSGSAAKKVKLTSSEPAPLRLAGNSLASSQNQRLNSIPFSLSQFQESLSEDERALLALECTYLGKSWLKVLKDEIQKPYFISLKKFLWEQGVRGPDEISKPLKVYPSPSDIYAWSNTPLGKVKGVIIGQDPYHGPGQAHGLCFSVPPGVAVPPSLRNIYAEIKAEYPEFKPPNHGNLMSWANNGVLMLNTCLTVKAREAGSHSNKGWETFTEKVVGAVDKYGGANIGTDSTGYGRGIVFMAWGAWAAKRVEKLNQSKHLILTSAHPSPFSAHKGFLGNGHFRSANEWLEKKYGEDSKVDWCSLDG